MLRNYLKIAWRNLVKSKSFAFLNIAGLSTGMACSILILLWVQNELSYDSFHKAAKSIYRITVDSEAFNLAVSSAGMGPDLQHEIPEIEEVVRTTKFQNALFKVNQEVFEEDKFMYVDSNFLSLFDFNLAYGDKSTALAAPNSLILSTSLAKTYFGKEDVLGKTLQLNNNKTLRVTGVLEPLPSNSHFKFEALSPVSTILHENADLAGNDWFNFEYYTYFRVNEAVNGSAKGVSGIESDIDRIVKARFDGFDIHFRLQPLEEIHLYSDLQMDVAGHGNVAYVHTFFVVALFILVVACINFMNLATARSAKRAREVGLRKAVGAERSQLVGQFFSESVLLSCISLLLATGLAFLILPYFNQLTAGNLRIRYESGSFWMSLLAIAAVTGLLSGSYPSLYLSGFNPVEVLKGRLRISGGNRLFRNGLVLTQFTVSAILIVGTIVVYNQLNYIRNKSLGYDKSNLIIVPFKGDLKAKQDALRANLNQNPLLSEYSIFADLPTQLDRGTTSLSWDGKNQNEEILIPDIRVDNHFLNVFDLKVLAGRGFSADFSENESNVIVNEALMKLMGKTRENIIGQAMEYNGQQVQVVGLVNDFHFKPLQYGIEPLVMAEKSEGNYLTIRTTMNQTQAAISALEEIHSDLNPAFPFTYSFLDEDLQNLYKGEQQMGQIFNGLAILALFISCLGIYGLSAYMAEQRTKEIGIRKVLGAGTARLVALMSGDFVKLIGFSLLVAVPVSWYYLDQWLSGFAYHITVSWWMFAAAALSLLLITLFTVSYQSIKTALLNPVKSLRSE